MTHPLQQEWRDGPNAHPDPEVAEVVALITEYQLGLLSDTERAMVRHRLRTDRIFAERAAPMLFMARAMYERRLERERSRAESPESSARVIPITRARPAKRGWIHQHVTMSRIAASLLFMAVMTYSARAAYGAILRSRLPPASVTFTKAPLSVVMAELRRRYHIEVDACDVGYNQDVVTLTLKDTPAEPAADEIARQTMRYVQWWHSPYHLRFRPQPDVTRGWRYNLRLVARSFTSLGCHQ